MTTILECFIPHFWIEILMHLGHRGLSCSSGTFIIGLSVQSDHLDRIANCLFRHTVHSFCFCWFFFACSKNDLNAARNSSWTLFSGMCNGWKAFSKHACNIFIFDDFNILFLIRISIWMMPLERVGDDIWSWWRCGRMTWISVAPIQYIWLTLEKKLQVISKTKRKYTA